MTDAYSGSICANTDKKAQRVQNYRQLSSETQDAHHPCDTEASMKHIQMGAIAVEPISV